MYTSETLSIGEVASHFGWTPRFVERLAVAGKIPGAEVQGQWRFRREDLIDWLDQKMQTLDAEGVAGVEHRYEAELLSAHRRILLSERLRPDLVALDREVTGKPEVLKHLAALAQATGQLRDADQLHAALVERESLCSTALPGRVAICHPRRPVPHLVQRTVFSVLRTRNNILFGAEDGEPTRLFFLVAATDERAHLYALARLVRILRGTTLALLLDAKDPEEFLRVIRGREREIDQSFVAKPSPVIPRP